MVPGSIPGPGIICKLSLLVLSCASRVFLQVLRFSSLHKNQPWFYLGCAPWPDMSYMGAVKGALVFLQLGHVAAASPAIQPWSCKWGWLANPNLFIYLFKFQFQFPPKQGTWLSYKAAHTQTLPTHEKFQYPPFGRGMGAGRIDTFLLNCINYIFLDFIFYIWKPFSKLCTFSLHIYILELLTIEITFIWSNWKSFSLLAVLTLSCQSFNRNRHKHDSFAGKSAFDLAVLKLF